MPKFTKKQIKEASDFLANPPETAADLGAYTANHSNVLFETLRAKVITGAFRVDDHHNDWNIARTNLTAEHQAELRKLLGWEEA